MKKKPNKKRLVSVTPVQEKADVTAPVQKTVFSKMKYVILIPLVCILFMANIYFVRVFYQTGSSGYLVTLFVYAFLLVVLLILPKVKKIWRVNAIAILLILFISETYLRISGKGFLDYMERNSTSIFGPYMSQFYEYSGIRDGVYWLHAPNSTFEDRKPEFQQQYVYNEIGLRERPLTVFKNNKTNILILGDSFTEGVGTPLEQNTPSAVENRLKTFYDKKEAKVINGGVNGSDLFFSYKLMERLFPLVHPEVVVLNINTSDISDVSSRGGEGRFKKNTTVRYENNGPWWEYIYSVSYVFRTISNGVFNTSPVSYKYGTNLDIDYGKLIFDKILEYDIFCKVRNVKFVVVFTPMVYQLLENRYSFNKLIEVLNSTTTVANVNLMDEFQKNNSITKENYKDYYYLTDYHFKPAGYVLTGNIIADKIAPYLE